MKDDAQILGMVIPVNEIQKVAGRKALGGKLCSIFNMMSVRHL